MSASPFQSWDGRESLSLFPKVSLQSVGGEHILFCRVAYEPGAHVPRHSHEHTEQLMWVLSGELEMTVGEETKRIGAGDCVVINPGIDHELSSPKGCTFLEALSPVPRDHVADPERDLVLGAGGDAKHVDR